MHNVWYPLNKRLGGPKRIWTFGRKGIPLAPAGIRLLDCPVGKLVTIPTELQRHNGMFIGGRIGIQLKVLARTSVCRKN